MREKGEKINDPALDGKKDCFATNSKINQAARRHSGKTLLDVSEDWPPVKK